MIKIGNLKYSISGFIGGMGVIFGIASVLLMRKLPLKVCISKVELSGIMHGPGGLDEKIAIYRNTDYLDPQ
jgi:hypothetical protein